MCSALTYDNIYMHICICLYVCAYTHTEGSECRRFWPCSAHRSPRCPPEQNHPVLGWGTRTSNSGGEEPVPAMGKSGLLRPRFEAQCGPTARDHPTPLTGEHGFSSPVYHPDNSWCKMFVAGEPVRRKTCGPWGCDSVRCCFPAWGCQGHPGDSTCAWHILRAAATPVLGAPSSPKRRARGLTHSAARPEPEQDLPCPQRLSSSRLPLSDGSWRLSRIKPSPSPGPRPHPLRGSEHRPSARSVPRGVILPRRMDFASTWT